MSSSNPSRSRFRGVGISLFVVLFGIPLFLLFALFTYGAILLPLLGLLLLAPFVGFNYALWGWHSAFTPVERASADSVA